MRIKKEKRLIITLTKKDFREIKKYALETEQRMTDFCRDFILEGIMKGRKVKK